VDETSQAGEEVGSSLWTWRDGPRLGRTVVFDLDGVLSDAASRQHFLKGPQPDWEAFFNASGDDPLVDEVAALLGLLAPGLVIVLLTARPARVRPKTLGWLRRHKLRWDLLVMRPEGDRRPARVFKQAAVRAVAAKELEVVLCVEDDLRNVEMFRAEGIPALYVHSGYYE
jgi:phosphoglycolate phosphatase-like HAD superfamily hydrolase